MSQKINIKEPMFSNLKIKGRAGTWYAVRVHYYGGSTFLELESEQDGDEGQDIIVNIDTMEEPSEDFSYYLLFEAE